MTQAAVHGMDDAAIRSLVVRLARPHASGGDVIARAAILAEGGDFAAVVRWITAHSGVPEEAPVARTRGGSGIHGARGTGSGEAGSVPARRFVFPPGALEASAP